MSRKTDEVYRRYAILDHAMIREAAIGMSEKRTFGDLLHNELHNRISQRRIAEIVRKINTVRWPRG